MDQVIQTEGEDSTFLLGDPAHYWKRMKMAKRTRCIMKCCMLKIIKTSSAFQNWWWEASNQKFIMPRFQFHFIFILFASSL